MVLFCLNYHVSVSLQIPIFLISTLLLTVISYWMIGECPFSVLLFLNSLFDKVVRKMQLKKKKNMQKIERHYTTYHMNRSDVDLESRDVSYKVMVSKV